MRLRTVISSALLVTATAAPVVAAAAPSNAASVGPWDRIAQCESGGRWHINTGNGYFGGLQISRGTWAGYGGRRYAALPSGASKAAQIRIGERIRHGQGWAAWPVCSVRAGVR